MNQDLAYFFALPNILWSPSGTRAEDSLSPARIGAEICRILQTNFRELLANFRTFHY
jgi:hypothetical protein